MNKLKQQYIRNVKSFFPTMGKEEKEYLKQLSLEIDDCLDNENIKSIEELYNKFGSPNDVINNYFCLMDTDKLIKRIQISKWIKQGIVVLLFIAFVASLIWGCTTYYEYKIFSEEQSYYEELKIME